MSRVFYLASAAVLCVTAVFLWKSNGSSRRQAIDVVLEPHELQLVTPVNEGDLVPINFQLFNNTDSDIVVDDVRPSCGCMEVLSSGGLPFESGRKIAAGSSVPFRLLNAVSEHVGSHNVELTDGERKWSFELEIADAKE